MNEDDRNAFIIELYKETMEDIRDRRGFEWQTFAVVNVIYLGALKVLHDYKGTLMPLQALMITIAVTVFTYIWFIRIWGNAKRSIFLIKMRNNIQDYARRNLDVTNLIPPRSAGGGWHRWNESWPLWSYRGICVVIWLYWAALVAGLWGKTGIAWPGWPKWIIIAVVITGIAIAFWLDKKYHYQDNRANG